MYLYSLGLSLLSLIRTFLNSKVIITYLSRCIFPLPVLFVPEDFEKKEEALTNLLLDFFISVPSTTE